MTIVDRKSVCSFLELYGTGEMLILLDYRTMNVGTHLLEINVYVCESFVLSWMVEPLWSFIRQLPK